MTKALTKWMGRKYRYVVRFARYFQWRINGSWWLALEWEEKEGIEGHCLRAWAIQHYYIDLNPGLDT